MHVSSEKQPVPIDGQWTGASLVIEIWKTLGSELPEQNLCSKIVSSPFEILLIYTFLKCEKFHYLLSIV